MKQARYLTFVYVVCFAFSCKTADPESSRDGFSGKWFLFEYRLWNGSTTIIKDVPWTSQQTLTFTATGELSATVKLDTILTQSRYYQVTYNDLIGPLLILKKAKDSSTATTLKYSLNQDILEISPIGLPSFSYRFRRL